MGPGEVDTSSSGVVVGTNEEVVDFSMPGVVLGAGVVDSSDFDVILGAAVVDASDSGIVVEVEAGCGVVDTFDSGVVLWAGGVDSCGFRVVLGRGVVDALVVLGKLVASAVETKICHP